MEAEILTNKAATGNLIVELASCQLPDCWIQTGWKPVPREMIIPYL